MAGIQSGTAEIRRVKKVERKIEEETTRQKQWPALFHRAAITNYRTKI